MRLYEQRTGPLPKAVPCRKSYKIDAELTIRETVTTVSGGQGFFSRDTRKLN